MTKSNPGPLDDGSTAERGDRCITSIKPTLNEISLHNHHFEINPESGIGICSKCGIEIIAPKMWWDAYIEKNIMRKQ